MKYSKNAAYDYEVNGITEENGYIKWYCKDIIGRKLRLTRTYAQAFMIAVLAGITRVFAEDIKAFGVSGILLLLVLNAVVLLLAVAPMREFLHLLPLSRGRFDSRCIMSFSNNYSVYNGGVNRTQILLSLILPILVFASVFGISAVLADGIMSYFALFLLVESCFMCCADVYMLFFCIKNIKKNETVFGEYKKI